MAFSGVFGLKRSLDETDLEGSGLRLGVSVPAGLDGG